MVEGWVEFDALVEVLPWGRSDYVIIRLAPALEAMAGAWPSAQPLLVLAVWTATSVALAVKLFRWG